ncbi:MAG TPA: cobalt-precorrin-6A reductase [Dongiaceae bacterium]|nr:cobalt-precorrin-6A reductase [Dongiaceae bacterium]
MPDSRRLLILGGTGEARQLADTLATRRPGLSVITSLAGRTVEPRRPAGELRIGGFGGAAGLADYLRRTQVDLVIDATHPYAAAISRHAVEACRSAARPLLRLERGPWRAETGDRWAEVDSLTAAARAAPSLGRRAFLTIGVKELSAFAGIPDLWFLVRLVEMPAEPLPLLDHEILLGRGPFAAGAERDLLRGRGIEFVIAKNSGGVATYGKIAAARELGLSVILLRRPELPQAETVESVEAATAWVAARLGPSGS